MHSWGFPLPRLETPQRPGTSHELSNQVLAWVDANSPGPKLLPWQRYVIWRGFEVAEHRLWRQVAFLVSRQQGKTFMMQRVLHARVNLADAFGGSGNVLNTHQDAGQAVELVESLARELESGYLRARANGVDWWVDADAVGGMGRGRVWRARAQTRGAITGQAGTAMVYIDELQDARAPVLNRTVRPILSAARVVNPQVWFSGTGEREESDVLRSIRAGAFSDHGDTLWLEWSAPPGCATSDRVAWRWASPDWSDAREETLAADQRGMPDEDFRSEYLVQHDAQVRTWVDKDAWDRGRRDGLNPAGGWAVAVEADFDGPGGSAAAAWRDSEECSCGLGELDECGHLIYVLERHFDDLGDAFAWGQECDPQRWLVGRSLMRRPEVAALGGDDVKDKRVQPRATTDTATALPELRRLLARERVVWDGGDLARLPRLRTKDHESVAQGLQLVNTPDVPTGGIRCAAWAVTEVQRLIGDTLDDWHF